MELEPPRPELNQDWRWPLLHLLNILDTLLGSWEPQYPETWSSSPTWMVLLSLKKAQENLYFLPGVVVPQEKNGIGRSRHLGLPRGSLGQTSDVSTCTCPKQENVWGTLGQTTLTQDMDFSSSFTHFTHYTVVNAKNKRHRDSFFPGLWLWRSLSRGSKQPPTLLLICALTADNAKLIYNYCRRLVQVQINFLVSHK